MLDINFNRKIQGIIKKLEYPMWIVVVSEDKKCTCCDNNEVPDAHCMKCLGTGRKIKIVQRKGVMEPDEVSVRISNQQQKVASNMYYFSGDEVSWDEVRPDNIVVRGDEVDIMINSKPYRSDSNTPIYYIIEGVDKKTNREIFIKNFRKLVSS